MLICIENCIQHFIYSVPFSFGQSSNYLDTTLSGRILLLAGLSHVSNIILVNLQKITNSLEQVIRQRNLVKSEARHVK